MQIFHEAGERKVVETGRLLQWNINCDSGTAQSPIYIDLKLDNITFISKIIPIVMGNIIDGDAQRPQA